MATVLPGSPPAFNKNDMGGTLKAMCNYTRTLQENLDFSLGQLQKNGVSMQANLDAVTTSLDTMRTAAASLQNSIESLDARVRALESKKNA